MSRETDVAVTLYSKKVMVLAKANHILPRWLRFVKGVMLFYISGNSVTVDCDAVTMDRM